MSPLTGRRRSRGAGKWCGKGYGSAGGKLLRSFNNCRDTPLVGIVSLIANGIQPLFGLIMSKRNVAGILWGAMLLSMLPCFMGFIDSYWILVILVIGGALGTGAYHTEGLLSAHDSSGEYAHLGVPLFMAGGYFFSAAAAPIAIHWVSWFDLKGLVWFIPPGLLLAGLLYMNLRQKRAKHPSIVLRPRSQRRTRAIPGGLSIWPLQLSPFSAISRQRCSSPSSPAITN